MKTYDASELTSAIAIHPGEFLKDELEARSMTQKELAKRLNYSYSVINEIINGKRPFSTELALMLEELWGTKAYIWINLQSTYTLQVTRTDKQFLKRLDEIRKIASVL